MRTRRTRKIRGGGYFDFLTGKKSEPEQPLLTPVPDQAMGPVPDQAMGPVPDQVMEPVPDQVMGPVPDQSGPSGNPTVDQKVNEIVGLTGYHMRAIINAISVCNSTMKMQNNAAGVGNSVLNAFGRGNEAKLEMSECGSQCVARSDTVKAALKKLLEVAGETPVLGFIASRTGARNSANYLGNSTVSIGNRATEVGSNAANQAAQAATKAASSVGDFFSGLTRKATPQTGGRRRTRCRR